MRLLLILSILIIEDSYVYCQEINQKLTNDKNKEEILIGLCDRKVFTTGLYAEWFNQEASYYNYLMDRKTLDSLKGLISPITITIVLGTWCADSKEQFPRFISILDYLKFDEKNLTIYCVDRNKKTLRENIDSLYILKVPTFIIYRKGKECGRLVESPNLSLEKDLSNIIKKSY
jgi:hypothetical protein